MVLEQKCSQCCKIIFITFSAKAKWFCWQNLIVLRMIIWQGPEKGGGQIQSIGGWRGTATPWHRFCYPWHRCHSQWWIDDGYQATLCAVGANHRAVASFTINSIQFYIYSMGNFGLGIRFVFLQIVARLLGNVCGISRRWPPTISSGIFPIWVRATPPPPPWSHPSTSPDSSFLLCNAHHSHIFSLFHFLIFSTLFSPFHQQRRVERKHTCPFSARESQCEAKHKVLLSKSHSNFFQMLD